MVMHTFSVPSVMYPCSVAPTRTYCGSDSPGSGSLWTKGKTCMASGSQMTWAGALCALGPVQQLLSMEPRGGGIGWPTLDPGGLLSRGGGLATPPPLSLRTKTYHSIFSPFCAGFLLQKRMVYYWRIAVNPWMFLGIPGAVHNPCPSLAHAMGGPEETDTILFKCTMCWSKRNKCCP